MKKKNIYIYKNERTSESVSKSKTNFDTGAQKWGFIVFGFVIKMDVYY